MLITFEGPEGSGKSTAIQALAATLRAEGSDVVLTREPGAGEFGKRVRQILLEEDDLDARAELLLFLADRANHVETVVRPAIESGKVVLCDRFTDSTVVYQGHARGLDCDFIRDANRFATGGITPDFTILFDLEPAVGLSRLVSRDRLDRMPLEFHQRVRAGFLVEAHAEPRRWIIIDASRPREHVLAQVVEIVMARLDSETGA